MIRALGLLAFIAGGTVTFLVITSAPVNTHTIAVCGAHTSSPTGRCYDRPTREALHPTVAPVLLGMGQQD